MCRSFKLNDSTSISICKPIISITKAGNFILYCSNSYLQKFICLALTNHDHENCNFRIMWQLLFFSDVIIVTYVNPYISSVFQIFFTTAWTFIFAFRRKKHYHNSDTKVKIKVHEQNYHHNSDKFIINRNMHDYVLGTYFITKNTQVGCACRQTLMFIYKE